MSEKGSNLTLLELLLQQRQSDENEDQMKAQIKSKNRQEMFIQFSEKLKVQESIQDFITRCATINDREERIRVLKPFFQWIPFTQDFKNNFQKSDEISSSYLLETQKAFNNGKFQDALIHCSKAHAHSFANKSTHASSLYWRSLILYNLNDPLGALKDLELALTIKNFPENNADTIQNLKSKFESALDPYSNLECTYSQSTTSLFDITLTEDLSKSKRQLFVDDLFRLKKPNRIAPALEDFVKIKQDGIRGRYLVTTKDVPIGTTLLVEKPIVWTLDATLQRTTMHCHHCLKKNLRRISCPNCVFAFFCDENCMSAATHYHEYECPCLPALHGILTEGVTEGFYLAFKLICMMGPEKLYENFKKMRIEKDNPLHGQGQWELQENFLIKGFDPETGIYDSKSYLAICHLTSIFESQEILFPLLSLMLTKILESNCPTFFDSKMIDLELKNEFQDFLAEKILLHYESFWKNMFSLGVVEEFENEYHESSSTTGSTYEILPFASRVFATASLINHSCDANVKMFSQLTFGQGVVIALKSLKEGDELLMSYGPQYFSQEKIERQIQLMDWYNFICACIACQNDWIGIYQDLELQPPEFSCPKCCSKLSQTNQVMTRYCLNIRNNFQCETCLVQYDETQILNRFTQMKKAAIHSRHLLEDDSPLQAQEAFRNILEYFQNNLVQPSFDVVMNQELFCEAIYKIIHFTN